MGNDVRTRLHAYIFGQCIYELCLCIVCFCVPYIYPLREKYINLARCTLCTELHPVTYVSWSII